MLVIVPTAATLDFTFQGKNKYDTAIEQLQQLKTESLGDKGAETLLRCLCKRMIDGVEPEHSTYFLPLSTHERNARLQARTDVAILSLERGDLDIFNEAFAVLGKDASPELFYAMGKRLAMPVEEAMEDMSVAIIPYHQYAELFQTSLPSRNQLILIGSSKHSTYRTGLLPAMRLSKTSSPGLWRTHTN